MKKLFIGAAVALLGISATIPAQAALQDQPWRYQGYSYVKVGHGTYIKACHWKRSEYVNGIYQAEMATTYTGKYEKCPVPPKF